MLVVWSIDYHAWVDRAPLFYAVSLVLLILVLIVGHTAGGARSWLSLGSVGVQPSEFAKLATVLLLTHYLGRLRRSHLGLRHLLTAGVIVGFPMLLVGLERDLGSAAMFMPLLAGMFLVAGVRLRHLAIGGMLGLLLAAGFWQFGMRDYQKQRITSFLSPSSDPLGAGYQMRQSKIAVGSGQLLGRGYGQGPQSQLRFLPERHTDFIMAVLAEEWGFLGVLLVMGLYSLYFYSATSVAARGRDRTGILLVAGLVSVLAFHVLYNTSMVIGLLPITGIPLPFLSYGGSFTLVNYISTGLILNVDFRRYVNR
jgi:rod shape determining protein RodA